jgi:hypothetical protein
MDSPLAAPIGRVARHLGLLGITLAVVPVLWAGVAFAVDDPPAPDGPEGVAALLRWCWTHRDAQRYRDLFTADYQFIASAPDLPWNRDDELGAITALFGSGTASQPGAASITLDYPGSSQAGTLHLPNEPYPGYQQIITPIVLHLDRNDGSKLDASGLTLFHLVRGDLASIPPDMQSRGFGPDPHRWYIQRWEDIPPEGSVIDHVPVLVAPGPTRVLAGQPLIMNVAASDPDGQAITSLTASSPPGAAFTSGAGNATGQLTWTPALTDTGVYMVTFTASNQLSVSASTQLTVRASRLHSSLVVSPTNGDAPLLVRLDASGTVDPGGSIRSFRFDFGDGTPGVLQAFPIVTHMYAKGNWTPKVVATDSDGAIDSVTAAVSVTGHNDPPVARLVCSPGTGKAPLLVAFYTNGTGDPDGQIVNAVLDFGDGNSQTMSGTSATHTYGLGRFTATLTVTDNQGATGTATAVVIAHEDRPPVPTPPSTLQVRARHLVSFPVTATDPDQDPIDSFVALNLPVGASFVVNASSTAGQFSWTPAASDVGVHTVTFVARNALADSATTTITVLPDLPPMILAPTSISGRVGVQIHFVVTAEDDDGDPIDSLTATPLGTSTFHSSSGAWAVAGVFDWTPATGDEGDHTVTFTARNAEVSTRPTVIHVGPPGVPPTAVLEASPLTSTEPQVVNFSAEGSSDSDGQVVAYLFDWGDGSSDASSVPDVQHTYWRGTWTASLRVVDNQQDTSSTVSVTLQVNGPPNLARNPSFESDTRYWGPYAGSLLERVAGGIDGATALQITGPAVINGSFGVNDSPDIVRWTLGPGIRSRYSAWVRSPSSHGLAKLRVTEYLIAGGVKLGMATSTPVTLTPNWQHLIVEYVTTSANATLDFQVRDFPLVPSEVFITDDIAVCNVTPGGTGTGMAIGKEDVDGALMEDGGGVEVSFAPKLVPMPMRESGTLGFVTSQRGALCAELLDLSGRRVRSLMSDADAPAGPYVLPTGRVGEDGSRLSAGVYFWRVAARDGVKSGRFVIVP